MPKASKLQPMDNFIFETTSYLWPLITLFQVVITIVAILKVKGPGPVLMLVGTLMAVLHQLNNYLGFVDFSFSASGSMALWSMMALTFFGRLLFLVGLLVMVQKNYASEGQATF